MAGGGRLDLLVKEDNIAFTQAVAACVAEVVRVTMCCESPRERLASHRCIAVGYLDGPREGCDAFA